MMSTRPCLSIRPHRQYYLTRSSYSAFSLAVRHRSLGRSYVLTGPFAVSRISSLASFKPVPLPVSDTQGRAISKYPIGKFIQDLSSAKQKDKQAPFLFTSSGVCADIKSTFFHELFSHPGQVFTGVVRQYCRRSRLRCPSHKEVHSETHWSRPARRERHSGNCRDPLSRPPCLGSTAYPKAIQR